MMKKAFLGVAVMSATLCFEEQSVRSAELNELNLWQNLNENSMSEKAELTTFISKNIA